MRFTKFGALCVAAMLTTSALAQDKKILSTDGTDPAKWDMKLDSPISAPGNHKVIYENSEIRIQSVTVPPGTEEPYHLHPYPSILVFDSLPKKMIDRDSKGNPITNEITLAATKTFPLIVVQPPQALHSVKNNDTVPIHLIRIEGKHAVPSLKAYPGFGPIDTQGPLPISTDGSDPAKWNPKDASAIAAPGNHKILFENENMRVISVTIFAGTTEPYHDHPYTSLLILDTKGNVVDHDAPGKPVAVPEARKMPQLPMAYLTPPQAMHAVQELSGKSDAHLIRIEFKKGVKQL